MFSELTNRSESPSLQKAKVRVDASPLFTLTPAITMSNSSTDLLHAGTSCSHPACRTIDFLPFKCSHCNHSFCTDHWQPTQHDCPKYDPAQYDRIVPQCPFCSKPVNVTQGQDINAAMERHIDNDCHIFVGKKKRGPVCGNKKCGKSLISPIICQVGVRSSSRRNSS
jgi:hypothetical protein